MPEPKCGKWPFYWVARRAGCRIANAFSTRLKLIRPRSSLKTTKMSKKTHFWQKVQGVFASKLRPQTQSSGFSDNWANQRLVSLLSFAFWRNLRAQSSINPSDRRFLCCSFLSWSCWRKLGKARKRTLESKLKQLRAKNNLLKGNPVASNQIKSKQILYLITSHRGAQSAL